MGRVPVIIAIINVAKLYASNGGLEITPSEPFLGGSLYGLVFLVLLLGYALA